MNGHTDPHPLGSEAEAVLPDAVGPAAAPAAAADAAAQLKKECSVINIPDSSLSSAGGNSEVSTLESDPEYLRYLRALYSKWRDCPTLTISYSHLSYSLLLPKKSKDVTTVPRAFVSMALSIPRAIRSLFQTPAERTRGFHKFSALYKASGCIAPGSLTLILAPPGHGKTSMLKALSGRLHGKGVSGTILYNGMSAEECHTQGINVARLCAYIGQQDFAFPTITVKETLEFAAINSVPDIELLAEGDQTLIDYDHRRADLLIKLMGLKECKDTIIGNELLRGVSGGQKKRVAVSEMLLTNARVYCLDEVSTGLDAAVTKHIFTQLREAAKISKAAFIAALLQPTPETYSLFDDVILLREGAVVYHGPRTEVDQWLRQCAGFRRLHNIDEAQFVLDVLTDPVSAHYTMVEYEKAQGLLSPQASGGSPLQQSIKPKRGDSDSLVQPYGEKDAIAKEEIKAKEMADRQTIDVLTKSLRSGTEDHGYTVNFHTNAGSTAVSVESTFIGDYASRAADIAADSEEKVKADHHVIEANSAPAVSREGEQAAFVSASTGVALQESSPPFSSSSSTLALDTDTMHFNYKHSHWYSRLLLRSAELANDSDELNVAHWTPYTKVMFGQRYPHSAWRHTVYSLQRQVKITSRDKGLIQPRIFQAVLMGFIFGTLFYQLSLHDFSDKMGLIMYAVMFCAFCNSPEIPIATEAKNVVAKQLNAGFYPTFSYTFSVILTQLPLPLIENLIFSAFLYFIPNLTYDAGRYFFFLLILCTHSTAMSVFFRAVCYLAGQPDVANQIALPFIVIFLVFGGFLLPYNSIPNWLKWCYWISPFSWSTRSLALNEFKASRYDDASSGVRIGDEYLAAFGVQTDDIWKWLGVVFLFGFFMLFACACAFILSRLQPVTPLGTRRKATHIQRLTAPKTTQLKFTEEGHIVRTENMDEDEPQTQEQEDRSLKQQKEKGRSTPVEVELANRPKRKENGSDGIPTLEKQANGDATVSSQSALPFTPVTIAWKDLNYTVYVGKQKTPKQLLYSVSGFALPGEMTALMGASGAGKTTLMDVIAARKTTGKIDGDILVNGLKVSDDDFQHLMGYVEQNDIHMGTATVREALEFSAKLRLPASVSDSTRCAFVEEVMQLVGLSKLAHRMVGDSTLPGLSTGQLKLVTIAVELVANPSILFLDEPTSGLDAPAALIVMRAIRNIAGTGRTVVCTIHQPSAQLFYMFDRLLLLRSGGRTVYFSKTGRKGRKLVEYFESLSGDVPRIEPGVNPANWMLDVIGAAGNQVVNFDFADRWDRSVLAAESKKELDSALQLKNSVGESAGKLALSVASLAYASAYERYVEVQRRQFTSHYRNPPMNVTRVVMMTLMGVLFGIIYLNIGIGTFSAVQSKMSALIMGLSMPAAICSGSATPAFFRQRAVYYREKTSGMYDYIIYSTALLLAELPYIVIALTFFFLPYYWMIGFANDAALFFKLALVTFQSTMCYSFLSQLWLALLPNVVTENIVNGLFMMMFFMFGGLYISAGNIPNGWKWFYYIDPVPKSFIAAATSQFYCAGDVNVCPSITVPNVGQQTVSDFVSTMVDGSVDDFWRWLGWLLLELAVIRVLTMLGLRFVSHIKR